MRRITMVAATLLFIVGIGMAQQWQWAPSPICARLKIKGAKLASRHFEVYAAQARNSECCSGSSIRAGEVASEAKEFKVSGLEDGRYFIVFALKDGRLVVPLEIKRQGRKKRFMWV